MPLPAGFTTTRAALHALACYVVSPARKTRTGRIGLRPVHEGFGTPPFEDGSRIVVRGNTLATDPGAELVVTTLRAAAAFLGIELKSDPGVGTDLPPFEPDAQLDIDIDASLFLGRWYATGQSMLDQLPHALSERAASITEAQLWPEHFDLAVTVALTDGREINIGFSPGDAFLDEPYVYVGPQDMTGLAGDYWNADFGGYLPYSAMGESHLAERALVFIDQGIALL